MLVNHELKPFYDKNSEILILGSMPSKKSRELGFYYMHPQNRFWKILSIVFNDNKINTIDDKKSFLKRHHIALYDVLSSCEINGSSDISIKNPKVNDFTEILNNSNIKYIYTTGKVAYNLYNKYCYPSLKIKAIYLPSTSSANCKVNLEEIVNKYTILNKTVEK